MMQASNHVGQPRSARKGCDLVRDHIRSDLTQSGRTGFTCSDMKASRPVVGSSRNITLGALRSRVGVRGGGKGGPPHDNGRATASASMSTDRVPCNAMQNIRSHSGSPTCHHRAARLLLNHSSLLRPPDCWAACCGPTHLMSSQPIARRFFSPPDRPLTFSLPTRESTTWGEGGKGWGNVLMCGVSQQCRQARRKPEEWYQGQTRAWICTYL